ncbi:neogenin-like isoform X3 [Antedon mediterranea]|uniref:neogenin-like isoform X3 n=1 Tax=Antedon mediterranea TaxID=105859 RepID=UPI003AF7AAE6
MARGILFHRWIVHTQFILLGMLSFVPQVHSQSQILQTLFFTVEPMDVTVKRGETFTMNCSLNQVDADYFWLKDEQAISFYDPFKTILPSGSLQVTVPAVQQAIDTTSGSYQCQATVNENSIVSRVGNVQIASLTMSGSSQDLYTDVGDTVILQCDVTSHPKPFIRWIKSGTVVDPEQSDAFARFAVLPSGNLEIRDVHESDSGVYRCQAENRMAGISETSPDITLTVNDEGLPPVEELSFIVSPPQNVFVNLGESIVLEVAVDGPATFTWFKKNEELVLQFDNHYSLVGQGNLRIENADELDTGLYRVRASNNLGNVEKEIQVTVRVPPRFVKRPVSTYARQGMNAQFECSWYSVPRPTAVTWLVDGDPIPKENAFRIERNGEVGETLRIIGVKQSDSKYYQCIVSNEVGNINAIAQLIVLPPGPTAAPDAPVPGVPELVVETLVSTREISLGWRSPRNPNGIILTYSVMIGEPGKDRPRIINTTAPALTSATIKDLIPDTEYEYSVCAWNSYGRGECTTMATVRTQPELLPPSEPLELVANILSSTSAQLSWLSPEVGIDTVKKYNIYFRPTESLETPSVQETTNTVELTYNILGLMPNTDYTFYIRAVNVHGEGLPSAEVTGQTYSDVPSEAPSRITIQAISDNDAISPSELMVFWVPPPPESTNGEITGYRLRYRKVVSGGSNSVTVTYGISQHRLSDLDDDTEYEVKILAVNNNGTGPWSNWVTGRTLPTNVVTDAPDESRVPPEPSSLVCYKYPNRIEVWWSPPLDKSIKVDGYILGFGPRIPDVVIERLGADRRHFIIENLEPATQYIIKLRAVNKAGEGKSKYEIVDRLFESTCMCYNWLQSLPKNATFFPRCCDNGDFKALQCYDQNDCWCFDAKGKEVAGSRGSWTKTEEDCNRPEACLVSRTVDCGVPNKPTDTPILTPPLKVEAQAISDSIIMVKWNGESSYKYTLRYKANFSSSRYMFINTSSFSQQVVNLKPFTTYIFDVKASDGRISSEFSIETSAKTKDALPTSPPTDIKVVLDANSSSIVYLNWMPPTEPNGYITGYKVYYSTNNELRLSRWTKMSVDGNEITTSIRGLDCNTQYYFMILAENRKGDGPLSLEISETTPACYVPSKTDVIFVSTNKQTTIPSTGTGAETVAIKATLLPIVEEATIPRWLWFLIIGIAFLILLLAILLILCIACGCCVCCADLCPCFAACGAGCRSCWAACCPCCCFVEDKGMTKVMYNKPPNGGDGPDVVFNIRNKPLGEMLPLRGDTEIDESAFIASETKGALESAYSGMLLNGGIKCSKPSSVTSDQATLSSEKGNKYAGSTSSYVSSSYYSSSMESDGHMRGGAGHTGTWSSSHATTNQFTSSHISNGSAKTEFVPLQALSGTIIDVSDQLSNQTSVDGQSTNQSVSVPLGGITSYTTSESANGAFTVAYEESTTHHSVERTVPMSDGSHVKTTSSHKSFEKSYATSDRNNDDTIQSIIASGFNNQPLAIEVPNSPGLATPQLALPAPSYGTIDSTSNAPGSTIIQSIQDIPSTLGQMDPPNITAVPIIHIGTTDRQQTTHLNSRLGVGRSMGDLSMKSHGSSFRDGRRVNLSKARSFAHIAGPTSRYRPVASSNFTNANTATLLSDIRSGNSSFATMPAGRVSQNPPYSPLNGSVHGNGHVKTGDTQTDTLSGIHESLHALTSHLYADDRIPAAQRSGPIPIPARHVTSDYEHSQSMPVGYHSLHSQSVGHSGDHFMSSYRRSESNEPTTGFSYSSNNNNSCGVNLLDEPVDLPGYQSESNLSQDENNIHQPPTPHVSTHPLSSFSVPGPPPHYGTLPKSPPAQPRVKISAPSYSLLKRQQPAVNRNRSHPLPVVTPRAPDVTYRSAEATSPESGTARTFSTEDLNAEMLNLEGLMKDLNAITQSDDIDC